MTKHYDETIDVTADPAVPGTPVAFIWRGRRYEIDQRLAVWRDAGAWWTAEPREDEVHRVLARPAGAISDGSVDADGFLTQAGAVFDLRFDRLRKAWRLDRLWD